MHITNARELQAAIVELEQGCIDMEIKLKGQVKSFVEDAEDSIITMSIVLGGGILAKKIFSFKKDNFLKSLVSSGILEVLTTTAVKNADKIKAFLTAVWKNIFKKNSPVF